MRILITGKNGLVGQALQRVSNGFMCPYEYIFVGREDANLTDQRQVESLIKFIKPDAIIHAAAKVGGIGGNLKFPYEMFYDNMLMNSFIIHYAHKYKVKKLLAFSSVCVFPENIPVLKENLMHSGEPYPSQFAYATAKRAIDTQIEALKKQYRYVQYGSIISSNIYGTHDNYNLDSAHVIPSLIHKLFLAIKNNCPLKVWGDGSACREFLFSDDLANIVLDILKLDEIPQRVIVSNPKQHSIKEIVDMLCEIADYKGEIEWQTDRPNGQKSRQTDLTLFNSICPGFKYTEMKCGLIKSFNYFRKEFFV